MTLLAWTRCLVVSVAIALIATPLSIISYVPDETEEVIDLSELEPERTSQMSAQELEDYVTSLPTRRLEGLERFTYPFTHPQILHFYLQGVIMWFVGLFIATVLVTFWNTRAQRQPDHSLDPP